MADDKSTNFKVKKDVGRSDICFSMAREPATGKCYVGSSDGGVGVVGECGWYEDCLDLHGSISLVTSPLEWATPHREVVHGR